MHGPTTLTAPMNEVFSAIFEYLESSYISAVRKVPELAGDYPTPHISLSKPPIERVLTLHSPSTYFRRSFFI